MSYFRCMIMTFSVIFTLYLLSLRSKQDILMKRYLYITLIALISIVCLQGGYLFNEYTHYKNERATRIREILDFSFDEELALRGKSFPKGTERKVTILLMDRMTEREKDSLLRQKPLPVRQQSFDLNKARKLGIAETGGKLVSQFIQDQNLEEGLVLNMAVFDSIFTSQLKEEIPRRFILYTKGKGEETMDFLSGNRPDVSWQFPIGTEGKQTLSAAFHIPVSDFLRTQWWNVILSGLCMLVGMGGLIYLQTVIQRRNRQLCQKEQGLNGTIHDLKAPLNSVVALLSYLRKHEGNEVRMKFIEEGETNIRQLVTVIESLLMWGRKDRQKLVFHKQRVDVDALVQRVVYNVNILYQEKAHTISVENALSEDEEVYTDPMYLENILRNLVENAVKYADAGVAVHIRVTSDDKQLRMEVSDNGWGIPRRYQKKLFVPFYQVPCGMEQSRKGFGLGLAQVKYVLHELGGSVRLESEEHKGSKFTCFIPITKD